MVSTNTELAFDAEALDLHALRRKRNGSGRVPFRDVDTFEGVVAQPLSLHKYSYTHGDPINFFDPSGHSEFSLTNLLVVGGLKTLLAGIVIGGAIREANYFISTPADEWSTTGALAAFGKGAASGGFGATLIGTGYFALEGIYGAYNVWKDPKSTGIEKALASVNMLVGIASAYFLKGQVKSQWMEWKKVFSKVPLTTAVQTDLTAIRNAFNAGDESIQIGKTTINFIKPKYGTSLIGKGGFGDPNSIMLTPTAFARGDADLMKTIIEENLHNGRVVGGYLSNGLEAGSAAVGQQAARDTEEQVVKGLTEDIYLRGQQAGWW